jgi:hypothetical protein
MRGGLPVAALAAIPVFGTACAQLFGIDDTTKSTPPGEATMTLVRDSVGATVISAPQDVSMLTSTFYVPDTANPTQLDPIPGEQTATNVWSAQVGSANPTIAFTLPDMSMFPRQWSVPSQQVRTHFIMLEHPNPQPPPMTAMEQVMLTLPTPYVTGQAFYVTVLGAWMQHAMAGMELPAPDLGATAINATIPYSSFNPLTGSPAAAIAATDAVLVLRYVGPLLTGVYQQAGFDQSATMDLIGGAVTMDEVTASKSLSATIAPATFNSRLQSVRPGLTPSTLTMGWSITAAPGYAIGSINGPQLTAGSSVMADSMITTSYGNPFESQSWHAVLNFYAAESRTFTVGTTSLTFSAQLQSINEAANVSNLDFPAPLAEQISIDSHQLNSDGSNVALDVNASHAVSLLVESSPTATAYFLWVSEITTTGPTPMRKTVYDARSTDSTITLPAGVFKTGSMYVITAGAIAGGFPNIASGDIDTFALPYTYTLADSGLFTVVAP